MKKVIHQLSKAAGIQHSLFWLLSLLIITNYFSISNQIKSIDLIYALFFHICLLALVYTNLRVLIPKLLYQKKYSHYIVLSCMAIGLAYLIHELTFNLLVPNLPLGYYMVSFTDHYVLLSILVVYWVISTLLKLSKSWFQLETMRTEAAEMALYNLRLQINPHFLLNTLNSIYGLSLKKHENTPKAILKLSELMKHMLYQIEELIPLHQEVENIQNFIDLQALRLTHKNQVTLEVRALAQRAKITPYLLLTFVENAFKHSDLQHNPEGFILIEIDATKNFIFSIKNTKKPPPLAKQKAGIGIENARKRLEIYYPEKHNLVIDDSSNTFNLTLTIEDLC